MKASLLLSLLAVFALASCSKPAGTAGTAGPPGDSEASVVHLDAAGAAKLLKKDKAVTVLDVRTPQENAEGRIAGAVNIDFRTPGFSKAALAQLDKKKPYLLHCQGGGRSSSAIELLESLGFENLYHLDGGLTAWTDAGLPIEK